MTASGQWFSLAVIIFSAVLSLQVLAPTEDLEGTFLYFSLFPLFFWGILLRLIYIFCSRARSSWLGVSERIVADFG